MAAVVQRRADHLTAVQSASQDGCHFCNRSFGVTFRRLLSEISLQHLSGWHPCVIDGIQKFNSEQKLMWWQWHWWW